VEVAAAKAALAGLLGGRHLELKSCSRWPEKHGCGQDCLSQIRSAEDGCLVKVMLAHWYEGKNCAVCGQPFGAVVWSERRPALKTPDGRSVAWEDVTPAALPSVLSSHAPICFNCYVAESFRATYPDLVIDRPLERRGNHPAD
jgi:hypothetical protein